MDREVPPTRRKPWHSLGPDALVRLLRVVVHAIQLWPQVKEHLINGCPQPSLSVGILKIFYSIRHNKSFKYGCFSFYLLDSGKRRAKCILMFHICLLKWRYTVTGLIVAVMCADGLPKAE